MGTGSPTYLTEGYALPEGRALQKGRALFNAYFSPNPLCERLKLPLRNSDKHPVCAGQITFSGLGSTGAPAGGPSVLLSEVLSEASAGRVSPEDRLLPEDLLPSEDRFPLRQMNVSVASGPPTTSITTSRETSRAAAKVEAHPACRSP